MKKSCIIKFTGEEFNLVASALITIEKLTTFEIPEELLKKLLQAEKEFKETT
jgi:hypothetical protein